MVRSLHIAKQCVDLSSAGLLSCRFPQLSANVSVRAAYSSLALTVSLYSRCTGPGNSGEPGMFSTVIPGGEVVSLNSSTTEEHACTMVYLVAQIKEMVITNQLIITKLTIIVIQQSTIKHTSAIGSSIQVDAAIIYDTADN